MQTREEALTIVTMAQGAAVERFGDELQKVLDNVMDENTSPTKSRSVTLKVTIKPSKDRSFGDVDIACTSVIAPPSPVETKIAIGRTRRGAVATEFVSPQQDIPGLLDTSTGEVVSIAGGAR